MDKVVNSGKGPQPDTERNENIVRDYLAGVSIKEISAEYIISPPRVYKILARMGVKTNRGDITYYNKKMGFPLKKGGEK